MTFEEAFSQANAAWDALQSHLIATGQKPITTDDLIDEENDDV